MTKIHKTNDYSIFYHHANRKTIPSHVDYLIKSFSKNPKAMETCPIIVSNDLVIIDGQHRLIAAHHLNLPVYYIIDSTVMNDKDVSNAIRDRQNQRSWKIEDYIYVYASEGNKEYKYLQEIVESYKKTFSCSSIISICYLDSSGYGSGISRGKIIKDRNMKIKNKLEVSAFLNIFNTGLNNLIIPPKIRKVLAKSTYLKAILDLYLNGMPRLNYDLFMKKLEKDCLFIKNVTSIDQAKECIKYICMKKGV